MSILLLLTGTLSIPCALEQKQTPKPLSPKAQLMHIINSSDLPGIKAFTLNGGGQFIDEEAIRTAQAKFESANRPAQLASSNEFLVMILVQALAPQEVKAKLGLP